MCNDEASGVGGKHGSATVAMMSHEGLDEVIQSCGGFLCCSELDTIRTKWYQHKGFGACFYSQLLEI